MKLVQVDIVGLQIAQTCFDFAPEALRSEAFVPAALFTTKRAAFGKNINLIALASQSFPYNSLCSSPAVEGSCIDPVHPEIDSYLDSSHCFAFILWSPVHAPFRCGANGSRTDTNFRDVEVALAKWSGYLLHSFSSGYFLETAKYF